MACPAPFKRDHLAKKIRGREGWLAPALGDLGLDISWSPSQKSGGKPPFLTSNLHRCVVAFEEGGGKPPFLTSNLQSLHPEIMEFFMTEVYFLSHTKTRFAG